MQQHETLILGAGLAGLSTAYHLGQAGRPFLIVEKSERAGGLCKSEVVATRLGDFVFDHTGHWLHLRSPEMQGLVDRLMPGQFTRIERKARIYSNGVFTNYPYQANTHGLPARVVSELLLGFHEAHFGPKGAELRSREPATPTARARWPSVRRPPSSRWRAEATKRSAPARPGARSQKPSSGPR